MPRTDVLFIYLILMNISDYHLAGFAPKGVSIGNRQQDGAPYGRIHKDPGMERCVIATPRCSTATIQSKPYFFILRHKLTLSMPSIAAALDLTQPA